MISQIAAGMTLLLLGAWSSEGSPTPEKTSQGVVESESLSSFNTVLGQKWIWTISSLDLRDQPTWDGPGSTAPPLSMERAVGIAHKELLRYVPSAETWTVREVDLRSLGHPRRWLYVIGWLPEGAAGDVFDVPVLMSGRPVQVTRDVETESNQ